MIGASLETFIMETEHNVRHRIPVTQTHGIDGGKLLSAILPFLAVNEFRKLDSVMTRRLLLRAIRHLDNADSGRAERCITEAFGRVAVANREGK
jgi:hypothetical protein